MNDAVKLLGELEQLRRFNRLAFYQPYKFQKDFHNAEGKDTPGVPATQKALIAGNQCLGPETDVYGKTAERRWYEAKPFEVTSFDGEKEVRTLAHAPIVKPPRPLYRVHCSDGTWFDCSDGHHLLTCYGYLPFSRLRPFVPCLPRSNSGISRSTHDEGDRHWKQTNEGYGEDYLSGLYQYGVPLPLGPDTAPVWPPLSIGAPAHNRISSHEGDREPTASSTPPCPSLAPLANWGARGLNAGRFVEFLIQAWNRFSRQTNNSLRATRQSLPESPLHPRSAYGFDAPEDAFSPLDTSSLISSDGNKIVGYECIGSNLIYDFHVPVYNNYVLNGFVHRNTGKTLSAAMETAIHATGRYPDWWKGHRFYAPISIIVGSHTNEQTRDIVQNELIGDPTDDHLIGTGTIPKECIAGKDKRIRKAGVPNAWDSVHIRHAKGGWSKIRFRAYEQGKKKHMGARVDFGWADEEPPQDIWAQFQRSTFSTGGILILSFTPEEGVTEVVYNFISDIKKGQAVVFAAWDDADHMTEERQELLLAQISPHERELRSKGIPVMGSGLVFPVEEDHITCQPFDIPKHWPRIAGVDFGWDHPFATVWLAHDRETNNVYLYKEFRESKLVTPLAADAVKQGGPWIPVVWPHDMGQADHKSGRPLADVFRDDYGVNMLPDVFSNPPEPGMDEGTGGNGIEVGLMNMLTAMEEGRFKVFVTCQQWLEERRLYHRKMNSSGKVELVKLRDDLISASRYAFQSLRHADVQHHPKPARAPRGARLW